MLTLLFQTKKILIWIIVLLIGEFGLVFGALAFSPVIIISIIIPGLIISLFYTLILKSKIWPVFWRGILAFILVSIVSLTLVNSIRDILSFILAGIVLGLSLGWGLYRGQKLKKIGGREKKKSPEYEKTLI